MKKKKIYVISGLGADFAVFEKIAFPEHLEVVFIEWLIPKREETFEHYVDRMSESINPNEPFYLLGYSFGGILAQEIHHRKPAEKIIILGSIKSDKEKSAFIKAGELTQITKFIPEKLFNENTTKVYAYVRKFFDPKNPKILKYFNVRDPYYLKWSIDKIANWKHEADPNVIQILADKDIVFPIKNSNPNYIIKGGTHLFPITKHKEISQILSKILT